MGCISSKVISRSISFQEELNQSFQRRAHGNPVLEEQRISSNGSDQLLALVCTANLVTNIIQSQNLNSESSTCPKLAVEPEITKTSNTWELTASLKQGGEGKCAQPAAPVLPPPTPKVVESINIDLSKRSKSCHWSSEHEVSSLALESFDGIKEDNYRGMPRARSFHTLEEYDAMVERIWLSREQQRFEGEDDVSQHAEDNIYGLQEIKESPLQDKASVEEKSVIEETGMLLRSGSATISSLNGTSTIEVVEDVAHQQDIFQKGSKRKTIANRLDSLKVPPAIEFPNVASLREWIHGGGQVYSPGSYVTPKFGRYSLPISGTEKKCSEDVIFNPELVAAFEECMQQLEAEEESILKQFAENLKKEITKEKQDEDKIQSHTKGEEHAK